MGDLVSYALADGVATVTLDDGKVNALSSAMTAAVRDALDRAEADEAVVVLTGRASTFSAGFDLRCAPEDWPQMMIDGAALAERLLTFPQPTVIACNGNAIAMGAFLLLAADHRIGVAGDFRIGLNEVEIGLTVPWFGLALARHRLSRPAYDHCTVTGMLLDPAGAQTAGFLDRLVEPPALHATAAQTATALTGVDRAAHRATKLRVREQVIAGVRDGAERIRSAAQADW
jgi:enoyl-CoA hydratase